MKETKKPTKLVPLWDRVIVRRENPETKSGGGIVIPDAVQEKVHRGTVVAIGKGRVLESGTIVPLAVKPGDRVVFRPYAEDRIEDRRLSVDEDEEIVVREAEIIAVIEEPAK